MIDKKGLKNQYKQTLQPMGVYQIKNTINGKVFIGNSKNLKGALNSNMFQLKSCLHPNRELQKDFTELGEEKISFKIVDYLEPKKEPDYDYTDDLIVLEEVWLEKLQPYGSSGYHKKI
jgi:hypothetical protein